MDYSSKPAVDIAVVGMSMRLPGDVDTAESFWDMLCEGRSARSKIPEDRFNSDTFFHPDADRSDGVCTSHISLHLDDS